MVRSEDQLRNGFPTNQRHPQERAGVKRVPQLKFDFASPLNIRHPFNGTELDRQLRRHETRVSIRVEIDGRSQSGVPVLDGAERPMQMVD
jgi:hypothetical protein